MTEGPRTYQDAARQLSKEGRVVADVFKAELIKTGDKIGDAIIKAMTAFRKAMIR